ncbi:MAG: NAD(P)/FAD-dependent oxidoreductase [Candidatus Heteroscillospira sp.]
MKYLIAGNGPAAVAAAREIRGLDTGAHIIMVSPENNEPYSRITVPELMVGEIDERDIYFAPGFYEECGVETRLGVSLAALRPAEHTAVLSDSEEIRYDKLLLATGAHPFMPPWADMSLDGMYSLWDRADALDIAGKLKKGENAVIAGAGLVAFQAARALNAYGMRVTLVARRYIMSRQLDARAADMLKAAAESCGVRVLLHTSVEEVLADGGAVKGVRLTNGETIETNCLLACMGTKPNLAMLEGLADCSGGLDVDDTMATALPDVYAAGDIVRARMQGSDERAVRAIWPNAVYQGAIAGRNMAGVAELSEGSRAMNSIELFGVSFISAGQIEAAGGQRELVLRSTPNAYQKVILEGNILRGLTFAGRVQEAGVLAAKLGTDCSGYLGFVPDFDPELIRE